MEDSTKNFALTISQYAKHRGVSHTAVQKAIEKNRLTEDVSFIKKPTPKRFKFMFVPVAADQEWSENTTVNGNNIHSVAGKNISTDGPIKKKPPVKKPPVKKTVVGKKTIKKKPEVITETYNEYDSDDIEEWEKFSAAEMKQKKGFYEAEREKVKLKKELSVLVEYEHVEFFYKQMVVSFKQKILQVPGKLKLIIGKENSLLVKEVLHEALEEIAQLTKEDFEKEGK